MRPRIHVVTLAVDDLDRSLRFYRDLGLESGQLVGTEIPGDDENPAGAAVMFVLEDGLMLMLYPRTDLAKDARVPIAPAPTSASSIGHVVAARSDVDALLAAAEAAGGTVPEHPHERPWGIYSGYFQDPDGHLWEIIWNPAFDEV
jgi:catechol 2,3-dioxygenase-like lactoylglutathione lyase family enzyme